jgi:hypothetical protein
VEQTSPGISQAGSDEMISRDSVALSASAVSVCPAFKAMPYGVACCKGLESCAWLGGRQNKGVGGCLLITPAARD